MTHQTGYIVFRSNGKLLGACWAMGDCEPRRTANTMIKFILSLTPKQRNEMKTKIKKLIWVPDKRPFLESNNWLVRRKFHLPTLPPMPSACPFSPETWWALTTLASIEGPDVLIPFRTPEHLLQRIMDGQKYVDIRVGWETDPVEWTWTVDFDQATMTGQKRDHLGWRYGFDHLTVGCFDRGLQTFPVRDFGHFVQGDEVEKRKMGTVPTETGVSTVGL